MDFLTFALDLVAAEAGIDRSVLRPLERRIRLEQGGDRHYIGSTAALDHAERRAAVLAALEAGATPPQVADRFGVSRQRVYQIKAGAGDASTPPP